MLSTKAVLACLSERGYYLERNRLWRISAGLRLVTRAQPGSPRAWTEKQVDLVHLAMQLRQRHGTRPDLVYQLAVMADETGDDDALVGQLRAVYADVRAHGLADLAA